MIVAADIHLKEESADTVFNQVLPGLLDAAYKQEDRTLAILGDIYHVRYKVSVALQNAFYRFLENARMHNIEVILLPGNHDQIDVSGENALEVFSDLLHVRVHTKPWNNEWGLWVPYRKNPEDIAGVIQNPVASNGVLWMHHGVKGAWQNDNRQDTEGLPAEMFSGWPVVFCGHYHKRQKVGNVVYVGSAYQTRADEFGQPKGYLIWNPKERKYAWVDTNWGKRYHRLAVDQAGEVSLDGVGKEDEVRITVPSTVDPTEVGKKLIAKGFSNVVVTPELDVAEKRLEVNSGGTVNEYAQAYVKEFADHLDPEKLMKTYQEIVGE